MSFTFGLKCNLLMWLGLLIVSTSWAQNISDLKNIEFEVARSFEAMNTKTGRIINISTHSRNSVKVIEENDWAYKIQIYKNDQPIRGQHYVAKKWLRKALNMNAVQKVIEMSQVAQDSTAEPAHECCDPNIHHNPQQDEANFEGLGSSLRPQARPEDFLEKQPEQTGFLPGCQSLDVKNASRPRDPSQLMKCIRSIQNKITQGARNSNGHLLRGRVYRNLYSKLNPQEQRFASMVFTAHGEAIPITTGNPPALEEMSSVMKVVENRMTKANQKGGDFNEIDVILDPWQFSMFNKNSSVWRRVLDPKQRENLSKAVQAYIEYETADFEPQPEINRVYHYHGNYVRPDWATSSKELRPSVNGDLTRPAPAGYNERLVLDRRMIAKSYRRVRHIFYRDIAWSERPTTPWRN